jgi:sn1-specific diacylglycerol lipase
VDNTVFGGRTTAGAALSNTVASALNLAERLALLPLDVGDNLTSASFVAANSALARLFPGADDAPFSLRAFVALVRREHASPVFEDRLPPGQAEYGAAEIARALVAWAALQAVTAGWKEREWLRHVREVGVADPKDAPAEKSARHEPRVHVQTDVMYPDAQGQVITAEVTDAVAPAKRARTRQRRLSAMTDDEVKAALRRFSKLVLAGYGGASLLFFGVSPIARRPDERASLASAIDASEAEAAASAPTPAPAPEKSYAWWNVLRGKHDADIFHSYANADVGPEERQVEATQRAASAVVGDHGLMPRFWVLSDHARREVVLVIRGTMSLNELAVDLTCTPEAFRPARASGSPDETSSMPGYAHFDAEPLHHGTPADGPSYLVHGGMLKMSRIMGGANKPVHMAIRDALTKHKGYGQLVVRDI